LVEIRSAQIWCWIKVECIFMENYVTSI
jgi:hypothetical protein